MDIKKIGSHISSNRDKTMNLALFILIGILMLNYMIITIIMQNFIVARFMRDIILVCMFGLCFWKRKSNRFIGMIPIGLFLLTCIPAFFKAETLMLGFSILRRYLFPLGLFIVVMHMDFTKKMHIFWKFILWFFAIFAFWGIFQAHILGDEFLINLGYPTEYAPHYQKDMLYNSYYFGGLGIQRVVATLSNSNVCGLILGSTLLFLIITYPVFNAEKKKYPIFLIGLIAIGYVLTFSRSNLLALLIVVIIFALPYIPKKKYYLISAMILAVIVVIIGFIQGKDGIIYKLFMWVCDSLTFTESSAAGRGSRWLTALNGVIKNPFGIGFGHVGSTAWEAGVRENYYSCENSYLAVGLDCGWLGMISYYSFIGLLVFRLKQKAVSFKRLNDTNNERMFMSGFIIIVYLLIVMFFSNHIYDLEAISIIYIYLAVILSSLPKEECLNKE